MKGRSSVVMLAATVVAVGASIGLAVRLWQVERLLKQEAMRNLDIAQQARASLIFADAHNRLKNSIAKHGNVKDAMSASIDPYRVEAERLRQENELLRARVEEFERGSSVNGDRPALAPDGSAPSP